ncbi:ABC transporter permease [Aeromonas sobria]|jgi:lipopolysaccharide transport system permease protein|uniref:ABC transporter permease n=1 Tax=Aeromonas sobria TaxID=646 RepID=UPI0020A48A88|nr:ABC transporter permease [Aeromonas sobria]
MVNKYKATPFEMIDSLFKNWDLIIALIKRDISSRYQNSFLGIIWSFLNPIFLLAVYTFIFSVVFKAKWTGGGDSKVEFALILFAGLIIFNIFSECVNRSPATILQNSNYVKKVIFPLEILPWVNLGASLFHAFISFVVWVLFYIVVIGLPHITLLLVPLILIPLCFLVLGVSWLFAALGVYLRDVSQVVTLMTTVIMFLSPIFYPVEALPKDYQGYLKINPLSLSISQIRDVLYWGKIPSYGEYIIYLAVCFFIAWLGFFCFQKMRKGFADVL